MPQPPTVRFDGWVLRVDLGELVKDGRRIRLQDQPLQVLDELLTHAGELVTREQLIARLWPKGVIDFDTGLNSAVRKLRVALQDEAETPRYIETVPRKGYRFIGTIDPPAQELTQVPPPAATVATAEPAVSSIAALPAAQVEMPSPAASDGKRRTYGYVAAAIAVLLIAGVGIEALRRGAAPTSPPTATESVGTPLPSRTIAVLPFHASTQDETARFLAQSVTDLASRRLTALSEMTVIASSSTLRLTDAPDDIRDIGEKLHARYLLQGSVERAGQQLHLDVQLVDAVSRSQLWSNRFDRPLTDAAIVLDEIAANVAGELHVAFEPGDAPASARINFDAYDLYVRGQQLVANLRMDDAQRAIELFRRATILDPGFARGYLALGQAQMLTLSLNYEPSKAAEVNAEASKALDRALELNPGLGEVWIERARLINDPVEAEKLYRKGMQLTRNGGEGYMRFRFAEFLFAQYRKGEAIEMMDRARQIDPLTPRLHVRQAFFLMVSRSDIAGHDRLIREALAINPRLHSAMTQLAHSRHEFSGEFADAARVIERSIALDPQSQWSRTMAATIYLDLDDPVAAMDVLGDSRPPASLVEIAQYRREGRRAAELARSVPAEEWTVLTGAPEAEAIRDDAIVTGDFAPAIKRLEAAYAIRSGGAGLRMWNRGLGLVYAHTLVLAGEKQRGRRLAESILVQIESESIGRTEHWFSPERATAWRILGDDERVLQELAATVKSKRVVRWWYLAELDPLYADLRRDPRFQALVAQASKHRREQRAALDAMRSKGEVPTRTATPST